jgi:CheY-like chemotaxis protein
MVATTKSNIEILYGLTHEEFIKNVNEDKTLQFQFDPFFNDERKLLKGTGKVFFNLCLIAYIIGPLILIPLTAYKFENWYLLVGILFSYFSTFLATKKKQWQWAAPLLFMFWYWYKNGFHINDYVNFFWLCLLWGGFFYSCAVGYEDQYAKIEVLKDADLFNKLSKQRIIYFMKKISVVDGEVNITKIKSLHTNAKRNIIHLDDHALFHKGVSDCITSQEPEWLVTHFSTSEKTLEYLSNSLQRRETIDLVITDINHGFLNGYEFAKELRKLEMNYNMRIPILVISMVASSDLAQKGLAEKLFDDCLPKNLSCVKIMEKIIELTDEKREYYTTK